MSRTRAAGIVIACGIWISCATTQPATRNAEKEVRQASDRFWATRERADASSLAAHFTDDAIFMVPGLRDAVGRSEIRDLLEQRLEAIRTSDFKVHRREIELIGDSAYELGWYSEIHRGPGDPIQMEGRYLMVWKLGRDGVWRVHRNLFNFSAAVPVEEPAD